MKKIPLTLAIDKDDLQQLLKIAREKHETAQSLIRTLISKQLKKYKNGKQQNRTY